MQAQFHCSCGSQEPLEPEKLGARMHCPKCKQTMVFSSTGADAVFWLTVGGRKGPPRLAVPVPMGIKLIVGADAGNWLHLPGEKVDGAHAELILKEDGRLRVKHVGGPGGTWINRASVHEGVLKEGDSLFIGPFCLRITQENPLAKTKRTAARDVDPAEDEPEIEPAAEEAEASDDSEPISYSDAPSPRQKVKRNVSIAVTVLALAYLGWWMISPRYSKEMPAQTMYRCPVDGTVFRAGWQAGSVTCPQCGALCFGNLKYKPEKPDGGAEPAASQPASMPGSFEKKKGTGP